MIKEILLKIQQEFKSGKNMVNDFAKFNYRNLECMLTDLKPILAKYNCIITFNDDVVNVGSFNYIKSTATLTSVSDGESISSTAFAREDESKAGMSAGQMTGCGSSYSRKYALCGLCAVNEEKDLDALDNRPKQSKEQEQPKQNNLDALTKFCSVQKTIEGTDIPELKKFYDFYKEKVGEWKSFNVETQFKRWMEKKKYPISA